MIRKAAEKSDAKACCATPAGVQHVIGSSGDGRPGEHKPGKKVSDTGPHDSSSQNGKRFTYRPSGEVWKDSCALQPDIKRRKFSRRGSKCPDMFHGSIQSLLEEIRAPRDDTTFEPPRGLQSGHLFGLGSGGDVALNQPLPPPLEHAVRLSPRLQDWDTLQANAPPFQLESLKPHPLHYEKADHPSTPQAGRAGSSRRDDEARMTCTHVAQQNKADAAGCRGVSSRACLSDAGDSID